MPLKQNAAVTRRAQALEEEPERVEPRSRGGGGAYLRSLQRAAGNQATRAFLRSAPVDVRASTPRRAREVLALRRRAREPQPDAARWIRAKGSPSDDARMPRAVFLHELRAAVSEAAARAFAGTPFTIDDCPWIGLYLGFYGGQPVAALESVLARFLGAQPSTATEVIAAVAGRVEILVKAWVAHGSTPRLPADVPGLAMAKALGKARRRSGPIDPDAAAPDDTTRRVDRLGPGQAIPSALRSKLERAFDTTLGDVRLHDDAAAARWTREQRARALTIGEHVAFGAGELQPGDPASEALLAHELAHVVQQREGGAAAPGEAHERDADEAAATAVHALRAPGREAPRRRRRRFRGARVALQACRGRRPDLTQAPYERWTWRDDVLQGMVDGDASVDEIVTYWLQLAPDGRTVAQQDLERGRVAYEVAARRTSKQQARAYRKAIAKIDAALQRIYLAWTEANAPPSDAPVGGWPSGSAPDELLAGTRELTSEERSQIRVSLVPQVRRTPSGAPAPFRSRADGRDYEADLRSYVRGKIDRLHRSLAEDRGAADRAQPGRLIAWAHIEQIARRAQQEVDQVFGGYARSQPLRRTTHIQDRWEVMDERIRNRSAAWRRRVALGRVRKMLISDRGARAIHRRHDAIPTRDTRSPGEPRSEKEILDGILADYRSQPDEMQRLLEIYRGWPGSVVDDRILIQRFRSDDDQEARKHFWQLFQIFIHEYLHLLTHDDYYTLARGGSAQRWNTYIEGVTTFFTEVVWRNVEGRVQDPALRQAIEGHELAAAPLGPVAIPRITSIRYASYNQAARLVAIAGHRNVAAAYFLGETDLVDDDT